MKSIVRLGLCLLLFLSFVPLGFGLDLYQLVTNGTVDNLAQYVHSVGIKAAKDSTGEPVLTVAARMGRTDMVKYLLENGADPKITNSWGETALIASCGVNANLELVKLLIDAGSDVNAAANGHTPLSELLGSNGRFMPIVALLLESGADVNGIMASPTSGGSSYQGYKYFQYAILTGSPELLKMLFDHSVDISASDQDGNTAIILAAKYSLNADIVNMLISRKVDLNKRNAKGNTALIEIINNLNSTNIVETRANGIKIMSNLISNGADPNLGGPILFAAFSDQSDLVELLVKSGAKIDLQDANGNTALMFAAYNLRNKALESLIMLGANVNMRNKAGKTALGQLRERNLSSAAVGRDRAIELLANAGARE
jgi:serine/threonine-protein phosphatase 6 regulatory ankyrin repeat subunit B